MRWTLALGLVVGTVASAGDDVDGSEVLPPGVVLPTQEPDEVVQRAGLPSDGSLDTPKAANAPDGLPSLFHDGSVPEQRYAMRQTFTSQMKNPNPFGRGGWFNTHTNTYAVLRWRSRDGRLEYLERTCGVDTEKVFGVETIYTQAFVDAVPLRHRVGTLRDGDVGVGPYPQQFGVQLADPFNDPLPTAGDDPHVVDADKDGLPGVTVVIRHPLVGQGKVWIAQRSVARLEGHVGDGKVVTGFIRTAPDMFKIDADRWWLRADTPQRPHPDANQSPFVLVPVGDDVDCAAVLAAKDTMFPPLTGLEE
ncbi:MAG: hypothetical protein H6733_01215 [Alphaproteobacteria bacterium]|nr:hypothetical protein [Alphaproteobacteria bacterium]